MQILYTMEGQQRRPEFLLKGIFHLLLPLLFTVAEGSIVMDKVFEDYTNHPCSRPCQLNRYMKCEYNFTLESYVTMGRACGDCPTNYTHCFQQGCITTNGILRMVFAVNKQVPGPAIHVCQDDLVRVNVFNDLVGTEGTSIHWHGILQRNSQHMDGVGMITQCKISASTSFEYAFQANTPGTHYWHAHSGAQRSDGIFGAFVVRQPPEQEVHIGLYDHDLPEHTFVVMEWHDRMLTDVFTRTYIGRSGPIPTKILVNGHGVEQDFFDFPENRTTRNYLPMETFTVQQGKRYRFRIISNGIGECPIQVSFDNHLITAIASDGSPFDKVEVESLYIHSGERYDIVIIANQAVDNYWIRFQGTEYGCSNKDTYTGAILKYEGAPDVYPAATFVSYEDATVGGKSLNKWNVLPSAEHILLDDLTSVVVETPALKATPDKKYYFKMQLTGKDNYRFGSTHFSEINDISVRHPSSPPLSQYADLNEDVFCNDESPGYANCSTRYCECAFRYKVALNDVVELVVFDEGRFVAVHPMHMHGHKFHVVGSGKIGETTTLEEVQRLDAQNALPRNLANPVLKDTVATNDGGYVILRWHATNPGFWLFHCHAQVHLILGQGVIFQVGEVEDMPPPPTNFPRCGNFEFTGYSQSTVNDGNQCTNGAVQVRALGVWASLVTLLACVIRF